LDQVIPKKSGQRKSLLWPFLALCRHKHPRIETDAKIPQPPPGEDVENNITDPDCRAERDAVLSGNYPAESPVVVKELFKTFKESFGSASPSPPASCD
jgi:hypothetical protein